MTIFPKGKKIPLDNGSEATIASDKPLGSGGQGEVYLVEYKGEKYALKWYTSDRIIDNKETFRENLENNIKRDAPSKEFLWPLRLTEPFEDDEGRFGYMMPLIPPDYSSLSDILRTYKVDLDENGKAVRVPVGFSSLDAMVIAALHMVKAFRDLQRTGYSYQDLNDGGFYINTSTGDVLICDCDNVSPHGENTGIRGKPGYMAPEVVTGASKPGLDTDKFSLAMVLFKFLMRGDPLEGKDVSRRVVLTGSAELETYGRNPVFVYDPNNDSNRPVYGVHSNVIKNWPLYPDYIRDAFTISFTDGLKNSSKRLTPNDWYKLILRLRDDAVACECGKQSFLDVGGMNIHSCSRCGRVHEILYIQGRKLVLCKGKKLYADQIIDPDKEEFSIVAGEVVENRNRPGVMGLKNHSDATWVIHKGNELKEVSPEGGCSISQGMKVEFGKRRNNFDKIVTGEILGD